MALLMLMTAKSWDVTSDQSTCFHHHHRPRQQEGDGVASLEMHWKTGVDCEQDEGGRVVMVQLERSRTMSFVAMPAKTVPVVTCWSLRHARMLDCGCTWVQCSDLQLCQHLSVGDQAEMH
jgi:hypothetical protein